MSKLTINVVIALVMLMALTTLWSYADSFATGSSGDKDLIFIVDDPADSSISEGEHNGAVFLTIKKKPARVWGPQPAVEPQVETEETSAEDFEPGQYPAIHVKKKVYKPVSTSYKYSKKLSSRHMGRTRHTVSYSSINITPIIVREAKKNNISPVLLKAVIQTESGFNAYATSCAGAMGLCQLMPGTARVLGVSDPYSIEQSIAGGARYLGRLKKMFGSTELILAAYNAGPGAVRRAGGIPNYSETRRYVVKVKNNMKKW